MKVWTREEVLAGVKEILVVALGVDEDEITEEATLTGDLGAESIDFLDIAFRLERAFGIKIPKGELFPLDGLGDSVLDDGAFSASGVRFVREMLPGVDISEFEKDPRLEKLPNLYTVKTLFNYVMHKLAT
ncbi:MAG: acyl carrier protein [Patescibacteria group bacterium]